MRGVEMLRRCPVGGEQAQDTQPLLGGQLACWLNHFLNKWICRATWSSSGYREQYGSTHKATVSMDKLFELNFAQFATKKNHPISRWLLACLLLLLPIPSELAQWATAANFKRFQKKKKKNASSHNITGCLAGYICPVLESSLLP